MFMRTGVTLATALVLLNGDVYSQQPAVFSKQPAAEQIGSIVLNMSGDLAREYARMTGAIDGNATRGGRIISTTAVIVSPLGHNKVQIQHSAQFKTEAGPDRLVTLTATVNKTAMQSLVRTVFVGDFTFSSSPADSVSGESPTVTARHLSIPLLSLDDPKHVKLRSWTLESETGK
jgi:hypothetical protein